MRTHRVEFDTIEWTVGGPGVRYKAFVHGKQRMRMIEFSEGFVEEDWCLKGHAGYVLDGGFTLDFNGSRERFGKGDFLFIPDGEADKHKAVLEKGEKVTLLLFEILDT